MKKLYLTCLIIICAFDYIESQQIALDNQFLINKFALSPAYAGYTQSTEAYATYRKDWIGIENAPLKVILNVNSAPYKNMGIGVALNVQKYGIFNFMTISGSYAYKVSISKNQSVRFGISAGIYNTQFDFSQNNSEQQIDPVIVNYQIHQKTNFDLGIAMIYSYKKLNLGVNVQQLLANKIQSQNSNYIIYSFDRHLIIHGSYLFSVNKDVDIEPALFAIKTTDKNPPFINISALVKIKKTVWLGLMGSSPGIIGIDLGGNYKKCVINYSFEFGTQHLFATSGGTHEISIGYSFGDSKLKELHSTKKPYYRWQN